MRVGRIPYINCYPVYGAIDRGVVSVAAELVDGVPTALNREMAAGTLDVSVISAVAPLNKFRPSNRCASTTPTEKRSARLSVI